MFTPGHDDGDAFVNTTDNAIDTSNHDGNVTRNHDASDAYANTTDNVIDTGSHDSNLVHNSDNDNCVGIIVDRIARFAGDHDAIDGDFNNVANIQRVGNLKHEFNNNSHARHRDTLPKRQCGSHWRHCRWHCCIAPRGCADRMHCGTQSTTPTEQRNRATTTVPSRYRQQTHIHKPTTIDFLLNRPTQQLQRSGGLAIIVGSIAVRARRIARIIRIGMNKMTIN
jgi:hypothetical protein